MDKILNKLLIKPILKNTKKGWKILKKDKKVNGNNSNKLAHTYTEY